MSALRDHLDRDLLPTIEALMGDSDEYIRQYATEYYAEITN